MSIHKGKIESSRVSIITFVSKFIAMKYKISNEEALARFMLTKTYDLLEDDEAYLWAESPEYVFDMYESEIKGDWEKWLEI